MKKSVIREPVYASGKHAGAQASEMRSFAFLGRQDRSRGKWSGQKGPNPLILMGLDRS